MGTFRRLGIPVLVVCVLVTTLVESRMKRGKYEFLESFCTGPDIYVAIPWDCSGYVHCARAGAQRDAYWIECPANLYYSIESKVCMWPKNLGSPCPPMKDIIHPYCRDHPRSRFQSPDHCAQFYDCSDASFSPGLGPYLKECPHPQRFNPSTGMCAPAASVNCHDRFTPLTECDYVQNAGMDCTIKSTPGCQGQPNGPAPYPNRILTAFFLICQNNQTASTETCPGGDVFDPIRLVCTRNVDKLSIEVYCGTSPNDVMANPANCARYFDCNPQASHPQLGRHQGECPYPQLYSTQTGRCEGFDRVNCGARTEPKAPCEYAGTIGSGSMANCRATYHSCLGLPDGANSLPRAAGASTRYMMCQADRTIDVKTCPNGNSYDPALRICTESAQLSGLVRRCQRTPTARMPDADNCARYFDCGLAAPTQGLRKYQVECDYPLLYNDVTMTCDDFTVVTCGARHEPKAPCDYLSTTTKCEGPLCALPCLERSPSCVGMADGNNTYPARELSPFYMTCLGDRTVSVGICRFGVYDPTLRRCTTELDPSSIRSFCLANPAGIIPHYTNCARYYNCSSSAVSSGGNSYLQECLYPQLFNLDTQGCQAYQGVQCTFRFEPKEPCEYLQNQVCPAGQSTCLPCQQRIHSCTGLENGNNSFVGRDNFYVVCQDERTLYVKECVGTRFDPATRACKDVPTGPEFNIRNPTTYCVTYPTAVVASPLYCSQYFDCSSRVTLLSPYKMECPYPQLFDEAKGCLPYHIVNCGTRNIPVEPCEYEANLRCTDPGACLPCQDRYVSCKGMPNGNHSIAGQSAAYRVCVDGRTAEVGRCNSGIFDATTASCQLAFDPTNPQRYCSLYPNALIPNHDNCAQFYDCRQMNTPFGNYLRECPYLQLYSTGDETCHNFDVVKCELRPEPKAPCDYLQNNQCFAPAGCPPCGETKPSCVGRADGNHTFPGRQGEYIVCSSERTIAAEVCASGTYDPAARQCGYDMSNPEVFCALRPSSQLAHPAQCAQYYDCRMPGSPLEKYLQECPYPALFDETTGACLEFTAVDCGTRIIPVAPCDYAFNGCLGRGADCLPCEQRFVSCAGRSDGNNSYTGHVMTGRYVTCHQGRTVGEGRCAAGYFDPVRGFCATSLDSASVQAFCQQKPNTIVANPLNCAQYFDCSPASVTEGTFLRECPYPMLFSTTTQVCQNFSDVTCGARMEPVEPCEYLQNVCDQRKAGCTPCPERFPSCAGLANGDNAYPGRPMTADYVTCLAGRTLATQTCSSGIFDPTTKQCGAIVNEQQVVAYCVAQPTAILAQSTNCAQYYDCRQAVGGSYLRECRYPQLFDDVSMTCKNFSDVQCAAGRYEPQAPCEYLQTQCLAGAANCTPCAERLPSCVGLPDGNNAFPGRPGSQYYVKCSHNRTVAVEVCQVSLFDPATRSCSNVIDPGVLQGFCVENPTVLIPDPAHCSRYYNCSDPSVQQGLAVPHKRECKYPRLFGYGATSCQLFTEIQCGDRYEPRAPCEYVENQCFNATCPPCEQNYPGCVGQQDGSNNFPGRVGTEYYIVCYKDRTVAIVTCTTGYYNHATRSCEAIDPSTGVAAGAVPV